MPVELVSATGDPSHFDEQHTLWIDNPYEDMSGTEDLLPEQRPRGRKRKSAGARSPTGR